ncbi:hypothetical protein FKM82_024837 [Ascaphus truei]
MSDSGHSQPSMFVPGRRRRRWMDQGPPGNLNLSEPGRERDPMLRDRDQDRWLKTAPALATAPMEKPIVLMKAREEGKPSPPAEGAALPPTAATVKVEKEGQRPTQPVYQIQNRGMGSAASGSGNVDRKS